MSLLAARLLNIFYRTGAPCLPVMQEKPGVKPVDQPLLGWLSRELLDAQLTDLNRFQASTTTIPDELLISSVSDKVLSLIQNLKELPVLNISGEEIASFTNANIIQVLKQIPVNSDLLTKESTSLNKKQFPQAKGAKVGLIKQEDSVNTHSEKEVMSQLILGSIPYPMYVADLQGQTVFFNKQFEKEVLTKSTLGNSIRKAEAFLRELVVQLLTNTCEEGIPNYFRLFEHALDLEISMSNIMDKDQIQGYLFIFELPAESMQTASWRRRLENEHDLESLLEDFESRLIADSLIRNGYNISHSAKEMGIKRSTLQNKIKRLKIEDRYEQPSGPIKRNRRTQSELAAIKTLLDAKEKPVKKNKAKAKPVSKTKKKVAKTKKKSVSKKKIPLNKKKKKVLVSKKVVKKTLKKKALKKTNRKKGS